MATVKDVAREAGVSVGTISRYLNGADIREDNKIRIEEAIKKLNYKFNPIGRILKTNKTNTIGVVIPNLGDIYATTIVRSIEEELYKAGYNMFVCDTWGNPKLEKEKCEILMEKLVEGLIIYPCSTDISYLNEIKDRKIPVITIDLLTAGLECDKVLTDNINATYNAVQWLINNNHRRIGVITGREEYFTAAERLKGYKRAMEDYSLPMDDELIRAVGFDESSGYEGLKQLMNVSIPPTAVLTCNYYTTLGVVKAIYEMGIKVPSELSLVGFDNIGVSEIARPALSIIVQPMQDIGRNAAKLMLRRIRGDNSGFPQTIRLKADLILRDSTRAL